MTQSLNRTLFHADNLPVLRGIDTGKVRVHGESLDSVLAQLDSEGLSREQAIVRFIQDKPRTVIL